jgi:hypothetical protein
MDMVGGGPALHVFGPHVSFRHGEMPQNVAEREFSVGVCPIDFVGRDAPRHAHGPLANDPEIMQKWLNGFDFHGASPISGTAFEV